jgi:hypothetical protein
MQTKESSGTTEQLWHNSYGTTAMAQQLWHNNNYGTTTAMAQPL